MDGKRLRRVVLGFSAAAALAATLPVPLSVAQDASPPAAAPSAPSLLAPAATSMPLRILVTSDARGYIDPCGCERGQFGGIARRAAVLASGRRPHDLLVDLGNAVAGDRPLDRLKARTMFRALGALRYDVLVPGEGELALGEEFEKAVSAMDGVAVACANLVHAESGKAVFPASSTRTLPDGRTVAVVGLTSPTQPVPRRYRVTDPRAALTAVLEALSPRPALVIVAAHIEGAPGLALAEAFKEKVGLFLLGRVPRGSPDLVRRGGAPALFAAEKAQYLAYADLDAAMAPSSSGQRWLGDEVPDAPSMAALLLGHRTEMDRLGAELSRGATATFRAQGRVGSAACAACHQAEYDSWLASPHAHAMATLREKGSDRNAECLQCHLQDRPADLGGAAPQATAKRVEPADSVGCEACHGPGESHIREVRERGDGVALRLYRGGAAASCVRCHDGVHSKKFDFGPYWKRVHHGPARKEDAR